MKKLIAALLCLCMVMTGLCAAAEEVSQAVLEQAFMGKLGQIVTALAPGKTLAFTVQPAGQEAFEEKLTLIPLENGKGLADLAVSIPGQEAPVRAQFAEDAAWVSFQGQTLELQYGDLEAIAQAAINLLAPTQMDPAVAQELAQLLMLNLLVPYVKTEQTETGMLITLNITAKEALNGVAAVVDEIMNNPRYWEAVKPVVELFIKLSNTQGLTADDLQKSWPMLKMQLKMTEAEGSLKVEIATGSEGDVSSVTGFATLTASAEQATTLRFLAKDSPAAFTLQASLEQSAAEQSALLLAELTVSCDKQAGALVGDVSIPGSMTDVHLAASISRDYMSTGVQAHLDVFQKREAVFAADLDALSVPSTQTLTANAQITAGEETVTANLFWSKFVKNLTVNSLGQTFKAEFTNDEEGNFTALLKLPNYQGDLEVKGTLTRNSLHAELAWSDPRMALRGMRNGFTAEVNATWGGNNMTAHVTINTGRATVAGQITVGQHVLSASFQNGEETLSFYLQTDDSGAVTLARLAKGGEGFEAVYTPDAIVYKDTTQEVTITESFVSETEHVVDVARKALWESEAQHVYIRTQILEEGENQRVESNVIDSNGQSMLAAMLACVPAEEVPLLSEQNPIRITPELVTSLLTQVLESLNQQQTPTKIY